MGLKSRRKVKICLMSAGAFFDKSCSSNDSTGGMKCTPYVDNSSGAIRAGLGALMKEGWGAGVTCLRVVSSLRGAHIRNCSSCAQAPLIGIS